MDLLTEGIVSALRPSVEALDKSVCGVRLEQQNLRDQIQGLTQELEDIQRTASEDEDRHRKIGEAIEKLNNTKKRVVVVTNLLQGAQVRIKCYKV